MERLNKWKEILSIKEHIDSIDARIALSQFR